MFVFVCVCMCVCVDVNQLIFFYSNPNPNYTYCHHGLGIEYSVVDMGIGGGFAAHFQLAASDWMRALAAMKFETPIFIIGKIKGYSTVPACDKYDQDWRCYFKDLSACQRQILKVGERVPVPNHDNKKSAIPAEFEHMGMAWWWGVLQRKMFRLRGKSLFAAIFLFRSVLFCSVLFCSFFLSFFLSFLCVLIL